MADKDLNPRPPDDTSLIKGRNWLSNKVAWFVADHTPKCHEVVRILSEGMERKLPLGMRIKLRLHHLMCCWCQRYEEQLKDIRKFASAFPEEIGEASEEVLPPAAKERLKKALEGKEEINH